MKNLLEILLEILPKNPIFRIIVLYPIVCALVVKFCALVLGFAQVYSKSSALFCILYLIALFIEAFSHIKQNS